MQGAFSLACLNRSRTREAPTPTNISTKSEPETEKKGTDGLAGDRAGEQGLTGARRTDHQHTARNRAAEVTEFARVFEKVDDLADLLAGLFDARHVGEGDLDGVGLELARAALADRHDAGATGTALHAPHDEDPHAEQQNDRQQREEKLPEEARFPRRYGLNVHAVVDQVADQARVVGAEGSKACAIDTLARIS